MIPQPDTLTDAYRLARDGVTSLISRAQSYSTYERQEIELTNQPRIAELETRREFLVDKRRGLLRRIAEVPINPASTKSGLSNLLVAVFLTGASFGLAEATVQPFNWGLPGHLFCAGIAILAPYATHQFLKHYPWINVVRIIVALSFLSAIGALLPLADIRANQFARSFTNISDAVVLDRIEEPLSLAGRDSQRDVELLGWAMIFAALGLELTSGLAWHNFSEARSLANFGLYQRLQKELLKTERELLVVTVALREHLSAPGRNYATFWRAFQKGLLDGTAREGRSARLGLMLLAVILATHTLQAADTLHLITAIDVTKTEAAISNTGQSEFDENKRAVSRLLASLPPGARVTALGVTDRSFTSPFVIFEARLSEDTGYFGSRLSAGRRQVVSEWERRTHKLRPIAPHTDLLGLFQLAAEVFSHSDADRRTMVVFSDMRNDTGVDLEHPESIDVGKSMAYVEKQGLFAPLKGVEIFVAGAGEHAGKKDIGYSLGLKRFWAEYFRRSGATLRMFSTTRDIQGLAKAVSVGVAPKR
ncbi:MAG: hypothetical protein LAO55_23280 [Acidobacteriia bacterium]|nr:hypothetical protein [Terriglobia bacterium]